MIRHNMEQGSHEWHQVRQGKLTSTGLKSVIAPRGEPSKVIYEMIAEEITGQSDDDDYVNDKMQRGIDTEPLARKEYAMLYLCEVEQVGFLQSTKWPRLGVSPDGLVGTNGAVEIKCPDTKVHVRYILEDCIPNEYKYQVLNYFMVHEELDWLDFISYDPRFTIQTIFIKRITRKDLAKEIMEATFKLDIFFAEFQAALDKIVDGPSIFIAQPGELNTMIVTQAC